MIARLTLWGFVLAMFAANAVFDVRVAHIAYRMAENMAEQYKRGNPTHFPLWQSSEDAGRRAEDSPRLPAIARRVFEARYVLTALPLFVLLYFTWTRAQVSDGHLGAAVALGAFALAAKVCCWELLRRLGDLFAMS